MMVAPWFHLIDHRSEVLSLADFPWETGLISHPQDSQVSVKQGLNPQRPQNPKGGHDAKLKLFGENKPQPTGSRMREVQKIVPVVQISSVQDYKLEILT